MSVAAVSRICVQRICQAYRGEQSLLRRARGRKARTKLVWSSIPLLLRVHGTQNTECCAEDLLLVPSCCATCSHQVASAALLWLLWAFLRALLGQQWDLHSPHSLHAAPLDTGVCLVTGSSLSPCVCLHCSLQRKLSHSVSRAELSHLPCSFSWGSFLSCCLQPHEFTSLDTWC